MQHGCDNSGPIVDTNHPRFRGRSDGVTPDDAKQSVLTHRQEQTPREALSWPAAQREAEVMNQAFQP